MSGNSTDRAERRVNPRYPVMWSGELRAVSSFDWYILDCRIRNVSISGVHVLVDRSIEPGRPVVLRIANVGDFAGQVAWSEGERLGICFDEASDRLAEFIRKEPAPNR
jgi:PilZ domain-containing protein